jgi:Kef-type K+ transport system membrane component KefB
VWRNGFEPLLYALAGGAAPPWQEWNWALVVLVVVLFGAGKALGAALLKRFVSKRPWGESLRIATLISAGSPAALATAHALHTVDVIDAPLFTALTVAAVVTALLAPVVLRWIGRQPNAEPQRSAETRRGDGNDGF